jgi:hypothetical protein
MALHMLGKDPESRDGGSPTVYYDDETDNYVLQGWRITDEQRRTELAIPGNEDVIEFPRRMTQYFLEVKGAAGDND